MAVAGRGREHIANRFTAQVSLDRVRRHCGERGLLLARGRSVDPLVDGIPAVSGEAPVDLAGILSRPGRHLRGEERRDDAVLVGGPYRAVSSEERRACALLAHESETPFEQSV